MAIQKTTDTKNLLTNPNLRFERKGHEIVVHGELHKDHAITRTKTKEVFQNNCTVLVGSTDVPGGLFLRRLMTSSDPEVSDVRTREKAEKLIVKLASEYMGKRIKDLDKAKEILLFEEFLKELPDLQSFQEAVVGDTRLKEEVRSIAAEYGENLKTIFNLITDKYFKGILEQQEHMHDMITGKVPDHPVYTLPYTGTIVDRGSLKNTTSLQQLGKIEGYERAEDIELQMSLLRLGFLKMMKQWIEIKDLSEYKRIIRNLHEVIKDPKNESTPLYAFATEIISMIKDGNFDVASYEILVSLYDHLIEDQRVKGREQLKGYLSGVAKTIELIELTGANLKTSGKLEHLGSDIEEIKDTYAHLLNFYNEMVDQTVAHHVKQIGLPVINTKICLFFSFSFKRRRIISKNPKF